jgi:hypothetical protein
LVVQTLLKVQDEGVGFFKKQRALEPFSPARTNVQAWQLPLASHAAAQSLGVWTSNPAISLPNRSHALLLKLNDIRTVRTSSARKGSVDLMLALQLGRTSELRESTFVLVVWLAAWPKRWTKRGAPQNHYRQPQLRASTQESRKANAWRMRHLDHTPPNKPLESMGASSDSEIVVADKNSTDSTSAWRLADHYRTPIIAYCHRHIVKAYRAG